MHQNIYVGLLLFGVVLSAHSKFVSRTIHKDGRGLTQEEEILANEARAEIAKVIENNLVRILAIAAAQNEEVIHPRQEDDGDDEIVTPNPNVLPQVAQILGAVFSGSLNITRVVDGTFGLVPNVVRNQLQGLVKLLTGENVNLSNLGGTTTPSSSKITEHDTLFEEEPSTVKPLATVPAQTTTQAPTTVAVTTTEAGGNGRYRVRQRTKRTTTPAPAKPLVDDEIDRVERDLRAAARIIEPYEHRDPRVYAGLFSTIMQNVNMTEVTKAVPSIFKGATQAFVMLENLGVLDTLPGSEVLEAADLQEVEENEE